MGPELEMMPKGLSWWTGANKSNSNDHVLPRKQQKIFLPPTKHSAELNHPKDSLTTFKYKAVYWAPLGRAFRELLDTHQLTGTQDDSGCSSPTVLVCLGVRALPRGETSCLHWWSPRQIRRSWSPSLSNDLISKFYSFNPKFLLDHNNPCYLK